MKVVDTRRGISVNNTMGIEVGRAMGEWGVGIGSECIRSHRHMKHSWYSHRHMEPGVHRYEFIHNCTCCPAVNGAIAGTPFARVDGNDDPTAVSTFLTLLLPLLLEEEFDVFCCGTRMCSFEAFALTCAADLFDAVEFAS